MNNEETPSEKSRRSARLAGAAAVITGSRYIAFNLRFLAERLSMPLLRKNVKMLYQNAKNPQQPSLAALTVEELSRSIVAHRFLQFFFSLIFIYSLLVATRGVAAFVKFDVVTLSLFAGPLLLFIAAAQVAISTISLRAQRAARCEK